ncbi:MAG: hypothetical protein QNJ97_10085 [Myxococcota bacterium]|nr:hypothetical protein [Myxococcota bacterium]
MLSFLGQFMVEEKIISTSQLRTALALMAKTNRTIGELAIEAGYITARDADSINSEQRLFDLYFGEIAERRGLLKKSQVRDLLAAQKRDHIRIGDALVKLGYLGRQDIEAAFQTYKDREAEHQLTNGLPKWAFDDQLFMYLIDYLPRLVLRMAGRPMKLGRGTQWLPSRSYDILVTVALDGDESLSIALDVAAQLGRGVAVGMFGVKPDELDDDLVQDAMMELMDILAGNTQNFAHTKGITISFDPPQYGIIPKEGFSFPMVTPDGRGAFILSKTN